MRGMCRVAVFAVVCVVGLAGCGTSDPFNKQPVSGMVKLKGQPVKTGQIFFEPAAGQQVATNATITDGVFRLTREQGLSPGKYTWKLLVLDKPAVAGPDGADVGGPAPKNLVPTKDNGGSFEVQTGQETKLDIAIP